MHMVLYLGGILSHIRLLQVLFDFCTHALSSKATTIKQDRAELKTLHAGDEQVERKRLAVQFRIGKKLILQSCVKQHSKENRIYRL